MSSDLNSTQTRRGNWPWLGLAGVGLVSAGIIAVTLWPSQPPTSAASGEDQGEDAAAEDQASLAKAPRWHAQRTAGGRYALQVELHMASVLSTGRSERSVSLSGALELAPAKGDTAKGWVVGRLAGLKASGDPQLQAQLGLSGKDSAASTAGFALRVDETGAVVERRFDPHLPVGARNLVAALAAGIQVVQVEGGASGQKTWSATEPGASDAQFATYTESESGSLQKVWTRTRGATEAVPGGPPQDGDGVQASGRVALNLAKGRLESAVYDHTLIADLTLHQAVPQRHQVQTHIALERLGAAPKPLSAQVRVGELTPESQIEGTRPQRPPRVASGRPVHDLVRDSGAAQLDLDWRKRKELMLDLSASVRGNPAALAEVKAALWQEGLEGDALRTQLEALAAADTPQSLAVLRQLLLDKQAPYMARHGAATLAATLAHPDQPLIDALLAIAKDESDAVYQPVVLAVASQARLKLESNPGLSAALREFVVGTCAATFDRDVKPQRQGQPTAPARWQAAHNTGLWLQALGTVGGDEAWPLLFPYLVDQRDNMRLYAIEGLRFIQTAQARLALAKALQKDPAARNRRRAAEIALFHPQQAMEEPVVRALREDPASAVQIGAAYTLAVWSVQSPGLLTEIADAEARTPKPEVKRILKGLQPVDLSAQDAGGKP